MEIKVRLEELYKLQRELLLHVVGMSYRTQEALKLKREIEKLEKNKE